MAKKNLSDPLCRSEILERLLNLQPDSPRQWGKMTPHQMLCHLNDSYLAGLGEHDLSPARLPLPAPIAKWIALQAPLRWPRNIKTRPEVEQGVGGTPPVEFERDREALIATIERFCRQTQWQPHPMFGPMRTEEWLRWGYLHADHHLRQFNA